MNKHYCLALLSLALLLPACTQHIYGPVMFKNNNIYQPKPLSTDAEKSANYISGGIGYAIPVNDLDNIYMGELSLDRAQTFENFNIAYGVFGAAGSYENSTLQQGEPFYFENKSFAVIGAKLSADFSIPINESFDFRIVGVEFSYSNEFGQFADFRKTVENLPNYEIDRNNNIFTGGLTSELAWRGRNNPMIHYAVRAYIGTAFGNHQYTNDVDKINKTNVGGSFYIQVKKFSITIEKQYVTNLSLKFGYSF